MISNRGITRCGSGFNRLSPAAKLRRGCRKARIWHGSYGVLHAAGYALVERQKK